MKKVYCVFSQADDPYGGGPWLEFIFDTEEKAQKCVQERKEFCDKEYGNNAKYFYFEYEEWEVE